MFDKFNFSGQKVKENLEITQPVLWRKSSTEKKQELTRDKMLKIVETWDEYRQEELNDKDLTITKEFKIKAGKAKITLESTIKCPLSYQEHVEEIVIDYYC